MLFDSYLFADYSGARRPSGQRKSIRLAFADRLSGATIVARKLDRNSLHDEIVERLGRATQNGQRVCLGQDHQYGIPTALGRELGLGHLPWRTVLEQLCDGSYGAGAPPLAHPATFAKEFNDWMAAQGERRYFYSAAKAALYGLPNCDPRERDPSIYRLTERCQPPGGCGVPKAFNRVGDNGSVGGQTIMGLIALRKLLQACVEEGIRLAVWPFDGLSITEPAYAYAHVLIEPYPTSVRHVDVAQTDASDALASADHVRHADLSGGLTTLLDLSVLGKAEAAIVLFEGWIVSHQPTMRRW